MYDVSFFCFVFLTVKEEDDNHNISTWAITVDITQIWDQSGKIISNPAQINYVFYAIL